MPLYEPSSSRYFEYTWLLNCGVVGTAGAGPGPLFVIVVIVAITAGCRALHARASSAQTPLQTQTKQHTAPSFAWATKRPRVSADLRRSWLRQHVCRLISCGERDRIVVNDIRTQKNTHTHTSTHIGTCTRQLMTPNPPSCRGEFKKRVAEHTRNAPNVWQHFHA